MQRGCGLVCVCVQLLVGGEDHEVIRLNQRAFALMRSCRDKELVIIPGATHLFEEPGTLEQVAAKATDWFKRWLGEHAHAQRASTGKEEAKHEAEQPRQSAPA